MQEPSNQPKSLSEISHLFLSGIREKHTQGASRPLRMPPPKARTDMTIDLSPEEFAAKAIKALKNPADFRPLGRAAEKMITEQYSLEAVLPQMLQLYEDARKIELPKTHEPQFAPPSAPAAPATPQPAPEARTATAKASPFRG